jgi:hypothetical protein
VGSIYGKRRPDVLFKAIKRLENLYEKDSLNLQVIFVGMNESSLMEEIAHHNIEKYVQVLPMVPHREAVEIMVRSHLLLLIKAIGKGTLGQIPGKFYEYIGSGNRILCLGPQESEVANIIREMNLGYVVEDDVQELTSILSREYNSYLCECTKRTLESDMDRFNSEYMADRMIEIIWPDSLK